jgi:hypothetical protein
MVHSIAYDLRAPGRDYSALYAAIKSYSTWCHPLESTWLVATSASAQTVRDHLQGFIDKNDGLLVTRLSGEAAWYGLSPEVSDWLRKQLAVAGVA